MDLKSIAKSLAASEAFTRSQGFVRMRSFLSSGFPQDLIARVWKSLFYCKSYSDLWMADKDHAETVEEITSLYSSVQISHFLWFESFLEMMRNEWEGIDPVRIDKFMLLVRYMLRSVLPKSVESPAEWVTLMSGFIEKCAYKAQSLMFHVADVLMDELPACPFQVKKKVIKPFISLMKHSKLNHVIDLVYNKILLKLVEVREEGLEKWLFELATTKEKIQHKARDRLYDAYSLIKEGTLPDRQELGIKGNTEKKKKKKKHKTSQQTEGIPEALKKVMSEFFPQTQENEIEALGIGKDTIELKHEQDLGMLPKKKKKKKNKKTQDPFDALCKDFSARTGQSVDNALIGKEIIDQSPVKRLTKEKSSRKVNFNLKLNSTKVFDTKNVVSQSSGDNQRPPGKSILKVRTSEVPKPSKKQKTKPK